MRRPVAVAAFALVLAVPLAWSQRGGARAGGGGHPAGMSRGPGFSSPAGMHSGSGSSHSGFHGCFNCFHPHFSNSFVRFNAPRYRYAYGYGYYWPWYWDTSSYDNGDSAYQSDAARQIDDLNQQVQQLREQLDASQYVQSRYAPPARPVEMGPQPTQQPGQKAEKLPAAPDLATVLVFRDRRIQEVKNYAIVGKTLVVIADERQRKIPLADLDLEATTRLNEERGVDFQLPR